MWQYFYAHVAYHACRLFQQGDMHPCNPRLKMSIALVIVAVLLPVPQLYVVLLDESARYCAQPMLDLAIASLVLSCFTVGFTFLFCVLIPVPRALKVAFHVFGMAALILGLMTAVYTFQAEDLCSVSIPQLWFMNQISSYLSLGSIGFLFLCFPFWLINVIKRDLVLDPYSRTGVCYEPVKCCKCLWHI